MRASRELVAVALVVAVGASADACSLVIGTDARTIAKDYDAGPRCDPAWSFGVPEKVESLSGPTDEETVRVTPNQLEAYVSRRVEANRVVMDHYTRATRGSDWTLEGRETSFLFYDEAPTSATAITFLPSALEAIVLFYDNVYGIGALYRTQRAALGERWEEPVPVPGLESNVEDFGPMLSRDGKTLYFQRRVKGIARIYTSAAVGFGISAPTQLPPMHPKEDLSPVPTADELTLYTTAFDDGDGAPYTQRVYRSTRASKQEPFANPVEEKGLDSYGRRSIPTWVSDDSCEMLLVAGVPGSFDVYRAVKEPP